MYQNIWYQKNKNTVHLWDDEKGYIKYHMKKYAYSIYSVYTTLKPIAIRI